MATPPKLTGRTAFRLAGLVAAIISLTNVTVFSILFFIISQQTTEHLKAHVDEVRKTLIDVEESGGLYELAKMVSRHASVAQSDEDIFLLTDKANNYVAGNIRPIPRFEGWKEVAWKELPLIGAWTTQRASTAIVGTWTDVKDGYLFIGDGNGDVNDARRLLLNGLILGIAISIVSAFVGGLILGFGAQKRVSAMEHALHAFASGKLQERVPRSSSADDIDHVAFLINATLDRLQALIGNLKQVSSDIAHDLRTPISRMRQKLEIIQSTSTDLPAYRAAVDDALGEIDEIAETFAALLRISEIEAGVRKAKFREVNLPSLLSNIVDALEAVADERGQHIFVPIDCSRRLTVHGDRHLLSQLFVNLIENSIVHCPLGSQIRVELKNELGRPTVKISDTGPGIPVEERDKVFRRLYRLEKSRSTRGSGLGLSLVAAIADLHGARISLGDNNPGLIAEVSFGS